MRKLTLLFVLAGLGLAGAANAEEATIKGVYMASKALCERAKTESLGNVAQEGNLVLTNGGIETVEFNCAFLQYLKNPRIPAGWVAVSMCEEPDNAYPELFSIVERTPGELSIATLSEAATLPGGESAEELPEVTPEESKPAPGAEVTPPAGEGESQAEAGGAEGESSGITGTYYLCPGVETP